MAGLLVSVLLVELDALPGEPFLPDAELVLHLHLLGAGGEVGLLEPVLIWRWVILETPLLLGVSLAQIQALLLESSNPRCWKPAMRCMCRDVRPIAPPLFQASIASASL